MLKVEEDTILDLLTSLEVVQNLMSIHEEQALALNNAAAQYMVAHREDNDTEIADLIASADVNGSRLDSLGKAALTALSEIRSKLTNILFDEG